MLTIKKFKKKIFLLIILLISHYSIVCFANNTSIQSLQELFRTHDLDKIESDLKNFSLTKRETIKNLSRNNLVNLYKDKKSGSKYIEKYYNYESLNNHNENAISSDNEVFAYVFSKKSGLNIVPPTIKFIDKKNPSNYYVRQYYFEDGFTIDAESKNFLELVPDNQKEKYSNKNTSLIIFDYLIGNADRNFNNYIISRNGSIIAFDHEYLFRYSSKSKDIFSKISLEDFYTFFYDKEIYDIFMNTDWEQWSNKNFSKTHIESDVNIKNNFLERIDNIKKQAIKFVNKNSDIFFREAKKFYNESLKTKKTIFNYLPPKVPERPQKYPTIILPVREDC